MPGPVSCTREQHRGSRAVHPDDDASPRRRELDGVGEQVAQELVETVRVAVDHRRPGGPGGQGDAVVDRTGRHGVDRLDGEGREIDVHEGHVQLAAATGVGQQVLGDLEQLFGIALDRPQHADLLVVEARPVVVEQEVDEPLDGGEGGPQLVGDGGHHVVLHRAQLAQVLVLLDQDLGHLALDGQRALPLGLELLAAGDVAGHHHVARRPGALDVGRPGAEGGRQADGSPVLAPAGPHEHSVEDGVEGGRRAVPVQRRRPVRTVEVQEPVAGHAADDLVGRVAEELLGTGGEEEDPGLVVDPDHGEPGGRGQDRRQLPAGLFGLAGGLAGPFGLGGEVAHVGALAGDQVEDGEGDEGGDGEELHHPPPARLRVVRGADEPDGGDQGGGHRGQPGDEMGPDAVEGDPDDRHQEDDAQARVGPSLGVAQHGDHRDVADGDEQPRPPGEA